MFWSKQLTLSSIFTNTLAVIYTPLPDINFTMVMKKFLVGLVLLMSVSAFAQFPGGGRPGSGAAGQNMNAGHFYGKVVDAKTGKGLEAVTVQLRGNKFDTTTKKMREVILATVLSAANGDFSLENLPVMGKFTLRLTSVGFKDLQQQVSFEIDRTALQGQDRMAAMMNMVDKDLGNIKMEADDSNLQNVTVTSTAKSLFEMGVDRKIFNVDKNLVSTGQTATEVMKQIPSLNVDIDGNVTLRNAAPQLFIDGRPTTLTMDQIPADIIDRVELITNPSAKFDASGGNAGILNIVLKKNKKTGYNGGLRAGIDSRARVNLGGDINLRQNKINMFLSGNLNQRKSIGTSETQRRNFGSNPSTVSSYENSTGTGGFGFVRGGFDYFVDNRNTISVAVNFNKGEFKNAGDQDIDSTINNNFKSHTDRIANSKSNMQNFGSQLSYKHNFQKSGHEISADVNYNSSKNNSTSMFDNFYRTQSGAQLYTPVLQKIIGSGENKFVTVQMDYENPITPNTKFEGGVRAAIRNFENLNEQYFDSTGNGYKLNNNVSNSYKYLDQVFAAYGTYSFKVNNWSLQLGLRAESSNYEGTLLRNNSKFNVDYPISLFPSIFSTYRLSDKQDIQLNYTRRINRPNFFQLIPFYDYTDPQNLSVGNPSLRPEFTNSYEISYNNNYKRGANFLASTFFKYNTDLITRYLYKDVSPLKVGDSAFFSTFRNANSSVTYGIELTNRIPVAKWWDNTVNLNIFNSRINGGSDLAGLTNERVSWFVKVNNNFKVAKGWSVQLSGDYQAKSVLPQSGGGGGNRGGGGGGAMFFGGGQTGTAQGYIKPRYSVDLAIRKEFTWKGGRTGSLTLSSNDIFRTQLFSTYTVSPFFEQDSERRRDPQVVRLNFNYRFGKFDAQLFKRKNNKADQGGGMDMIGQ
jgi:outer membrane receptor protein involved in Fe transport